MKRSKFTRAGEIANERLVEDVLDPDRYPEGTTFIAADREGFDAILAETVAEHRPLAIVYPDGREIVAAPCGGALAFFEHLLSRRRAENKLGVLLPVGYQVEIRGRQPAAD
jgi:hypothetical protein